MKKEKMKCAVNIIWDEDARVWVAISDDVPGLALESGSIDALIERVRFAAPELLEMNLGYKGEATLLFRAKREMPAILV